VILYDCLLLFGTLLAAWKKPYHFRRLFPPVPDPRGKEVIWIHAVSVGETKAVQTLFRSLKHEHPNEFFLVTTTTQTGQTEARRCLPEADAIAFLPVDHRWNARRFAQTLRPKLFLLIESDFWPQLFKALKETGTKIVLVNGKLSERSSCRFARFPFFSQRLFEKIDLLIVQNEEHARRFQLLAPPTKIHIGGNLKLDYQPTPIDLPFWQEKIPLARPALTLSCTHAPEEERLLDLIPLDRYFLFLAPRHPERFEEVAELLRGKKIPFYRWSRLDERRGGERVLLVDAMGRLPICYSLSRLAIVGGSFGSHVGGHNILEPCFYGIPVLFGPHMHAQEELAARVLRARAGLQIDLQGLPGMIERFFQIPTQERAMREAARALTEAGRGASAATQAILERYLKKV